MKMFLFCTFLFFTSICSGQIISNGKDLKDVKDDYIMVMQMISTTAGGKVTWVGTWGIDTTGFAKANEAAAGKSLKTLTTEFDNEQRKLVENCQIKDEKGTPQYFRDYIGVFNALSRLGFAYSFKEAPIVIGQSVVTSYIFVRRK
jgi:hypothetical protein